MGRLSALLRYPISGLVCAGLKAEANLRERAGDKENVFSAVKKPAHSCGEMDLPFGSKSLAKNNNMEDSMKDITNLINHPLILLMLLLTIIGASSPSIKAAKNRRGFYFTKEFHNGAHALTACADGYHMASLWEIFDTSNLKYNTALGVTTDDSGFGPPTAVDAGWIRTGGSSEGQIGQVGVDNCFVWSSESTTDFGTGVRPARGWSLTPSNTGPWDITLRSCSDQFQVWCVED